MKRLMMSWLWVLAAVIGTCGGIQVSGWAQSAQDQEPSATKQEPQDATPPPIQLRLADDQLELTAPGAWVKVEPAVRIIEAEFAIAPAEGDTKKGRLTIMAAGGSIDDNLARWCSQFKQPDGSATENQAETRQKEIAGATVYFFDARGTFLEQRGPQAPLTELEDYRMLGAIIETPNSGNYFVKFYGPQKTVEQNQDAFGKMIDSLTLHAP
jgi:gluconolactonase